MVHGLKADKWTDLLWSRNTCVYCVHAHTNTHTHTWLHTCLQADTSSSPIQGDLTGEETHHRMAGWEVFMKAVSLRPGVFWTHWHNYMTDRAAQSWVWLCSSLTAGLELSSHWPSHQGLGETRLLKLVKTERQTDKLIMTGETKLIISISKEIVTKACDFYCCLFHLKGLEWCVKHIFDALKHKVTCEPYWQEKNKREESMSNGWKKEQHGKNIWRQEILGGLLGQMSALMHNILPWEFQLPLTLSAGSFNF